MILPPSIGEAAKRKFGSNYLLTPIKSAGSSRTFYRLKTPKNKTAVFMVWDGKDGDWDYSNGSFQTRRKNGFTENQRV